MPNTYTINYINVGNTPNDGQGEPLRTAFVKINQNLSNVYSLANDAANVAANAATLAANAAAGGGGGNVSLVGYATIGYVSNTISNLVNLTALNNALANLSAVNLTVLNNALANLNYVNLGQLNSAIANISTVNLGALNNALANVNVTSLPNFTNVINTIAANAANVAKVNIVSNLSANGTANGQAVYNSTNGGLYIWQGNAWISPSAAFTPTANSISGVEIFTTFTLPTGPGDGKDFNGRQGFYNNNLYIKVGGAWASYNSFITGSGTPVLSAGIITATELAAGSVIAGKIAAAAITSTEIAAGNITSSLLAANSIIAGKIAAGVITASEIATGTLTATQIAVNAITADKIAANAITADKIAANAVTAVTVAANAVYAAAIQSNAITADKIAANAVTAVSVAANSIYGNSIMAGTITGDRILANSVSGMVLIGNTIFGNAIVANSIEGDRIKANSVSGIVITANTLFANAIQAFSITSDRIAANAVTADKIDGRGLVIRDASGNPLFDVGGVLSAAVTVGVGGTTLGTLAGITPLQFTGSGSSFPGSPTINNVFKLTTDNNTYVYTSTGWILFVPGGSTGQSAYAAAVAGGFVGTEAQWLTSLKGTNGVTTTVTLDGVRGTAQVAYATAGTSWSDSVANAGLASFGFAGKIVMDQVTLYNIVSAYSETRFWNGSAWTAIAAYLNGSLLVNGTVGATKIAASSITATQIAAGSITADKISVSSLSALSADIGTITTGRIQGDVVFSGSISAASGTFSGKLTAQAIDAVDTTNIVNNAVTNPYILNGGDTATSVYTGYGAETLGLPATFTCTGTGIYISYSSVLYIYALLSSGGGQGRQFYPYYASWTVYLMRTDYTGYTTTLVNLGTISKEASGGGYLETWLPITGSFYDIPPAGAVTYRIKLVFSYSGSTGTGYGATHQIRNEVLFAAELKK